MRTIPLGAIGACLLVFLTASASSFAQTGIAINTSGGAPDAAAMLDVQSSNSGILVPRMTLVQRNAIATPPTSLLVYQTDNTPGYYYNLGTPGSPNWVRIGDSATGIQSISVTAPVQSTGGANPTISMPAANGSTNGYLTSTDWNTFNNKQTNTLANGNIWVGNAANTAQPVTMSQDVTMTNTGVATISNNAVTSAKIADGTVASVDIADGTVASVDIADGTVADVDLTTVATPGTYTKVTVNAQGRVTTGANLAAGDVPAGSGNYIQNQSASAQTANYYINGAGRANTLRSNSGTGGYAGLAAGSATNAGYVEFFNSGATRLGYIGWDNTNLTYQSENGASHVFNGSGAVITNINLEAREGIYTKKSYYYATYSRNNTNGYGSATNTLGAFDFCALAGQSSTIDEDDGDQSADLQCNIYTNNGSQPAWGDNTNGTAATMNYAYNARPTWYMYIEAFGSKDYRNITCNAICINFDY